jgi:hypothetical protein
MDSKGAIVNLSASILGGAVGPHWFDNVSMFVKHRVLKGGTTCKLTTLIYSNETITCAEFVHECPEDGYWRFFGGSEEYPYLT